MTDQPPQPPPGQPYPGAGYPGQAYGQPGYPPQGSPPQGLPPQGHAPVPTRRRQSLLVGLVIGLVVGAGGLGLAWALSGSDGAEADAEAVCGIVERSAIPTEDDPPEEFRRWAVSEVAVSMAAVDDRYQPLADALERALRAMQQFDLEEMERSANRAKEICADL